MFNCVFLRLQAFVMPHDIVATKDGSVFVGDAGSQSVFKFTSESKFSVVSTAVNPNN